MKIFKVGSEQNWTNNNMTVICNFNFNCNFHCSYCINKNFHDKFKTILSVKALHNLMDYLPQLNKDKYMFYIAGGEPALYPYWDIFFDIINEKFNSDTECTIATNGFFLQKFEPLIKKSKNYFLNLLISMHTQQLSVSEYLQRFKSFKYPENCKIKFMLEPNSLNYALETIEKLKDMGYKNFIVQSIVINQKLHPDYNDEEIKFFDTNPYQEDFCIKFSWIDDNGNIDSRLIKRDEFILHPELIDFSGKYCLAGANAIRVLADGKVTPCYAHRGDQNFNLNDDTILKYSYINKAVVCPSKRCACPPYTALPKWNPNHGCSPEYFTGEFEK